MRTLDQISPKTSGLRFGRIWAVGCLFLVFIFTFSVLAVQLFGELDIDGIRFDTFGWAFLQTSLVILGENWISIMDETVVASGTNSTSLFFIAIVIIGNYWILNLVMAILLSVDTLEPKIQFQRKALRVAWVAQSFPMKAAFKKWFLVTKSGGGSNRTARIWSRTQSAPPRESQVEDLTRVTALKKNGRDLDYALHFETEESAAHRRTLQLLNRATLSPGDSRGNLDPLDPFRNTVRRQQLASR